MGIQDRDYYWEKHQKLNKTVSRDFERLLDRKPRGPQRKRNNSGIRYLAYLGLMMAALWYAADVLLKQKAGRKLSIVPATASQPIAKIPLYQPSNVQIKTRLIGGGIRLTADRQGHFRGTALVNGIPMPFLIDTGATKTVIPTKLAASAGLPYGRYVQAHTAGGKVAERETFIDTLQLGNATIKNLDAHTNPHLDEVLIGMNTLKFFRMTQNANTLTLQADNQPMASSTALPVISMHDQDALINERRFKKPLTIKKTVNCDAHQVCTTKYSDH